MRRARNVSTTARFVANKTPDLNRQTLQLFFFLCFDRALLFRALPYLEFLCRTKLYFILTIFLIYFVSSFA